MNRENDIRISVVSIPQADKYSGRRYFVDEVAYDHNGNPYSNNVGSYKTLREANRKGMELAKEHGLNFCAHDIEELIK